MRIIKELNDVKLVIVDLEVKLGSETRNAPTLCANVPPHRGGWSTVTQSAHSGRAEVGRVVSKVTFTFVFITTCHIEADKLLAASTL